MHALSDEERERRQQLRDASLKQGMSPDDIGFLSEWWKAHVALKQARDTVVSRLFSSAGYGRFRIPVPPFDNGFELLANLTPSSTTLKIEKMSERRLRSLQEEAVVEDLEQPAFDN